jgi:hypothetical protein
MPRRSHGVPARSPACERIAMPAKPVRVRSAISVRMVWLAAVFNRAISGCHFDGPFVGVVRARRSARTLGGFAIGTACHLEISCLMGMR